ncbi:hypothetical protein LTS18_000923, partial [Coniosporium uncinatum]
PPRPRRDERDRSRRRPPPSRYPEEDDRYYSDDRDYRRRDDGLRRARSQRGPRDRYSDDRDRYDDRDRPRQRGRGGQLPNIPGIKLDKEWQKQGAEMFMTYAMPTIKREGGKYLMKNMHKFLS